MAANPQISPISQLLNSLGITREDLGKRSDQMRQFLTAEASQSSRVLDHDNINNSRSSSELRSTSKASTSTSILARSMSRASSTSLRDASPPVTPVKSEPVEGAVPLRHFDSMEMVIERQRRQSRKEKKGRKDKDRDLVTRMSMPQPHSPTPSNAGFSLDSFMQSRDDRRVSAPGTDDILENGTIQQEAQSLPPITPQRSNYYRDHTNLPSTSRSRKGAHSPKPESPTPTRRRNLLQPQPQRQPTPQPQLQSLPLPPPQQDDPLIPPVTPQLRRSYAPIHLPASSPLPSSSPPPASSPFSSPSRRIVNIVSSPGPMGPLPIEDDYDDLPYTLPPGPYSPTKPDLSYAALVGQAILSSPEHRLTLQEIYDWITIVYPHFKRGETTWMNSIRHVLSTTVCFRKVTRERAIGRTLWAIWDEDLPCFKNGGFKKNLCKDMNTSNGKEKDMTKKGKPRVRKRSMAEMSELEPDVTPQAKKVKRTKDKAPAAPRMLAALPVHPSYLLPAPGLPSHSLPLFPPTRPTPHHQPYYESCMPQPIPSEIIFPPLPPSSAYHRLTSMSAFSSTSASTSMSQTSPSGMEDLDSESSPPSAYQPSSSSSCLPGLTPNRSSSSPPLSLPSTSEVDMDMDDDVCIVDGTGGAERNIGDTDSASVSGPDQDLDGNGDEDDKVFNGTILGPVQFWGDKPKPGADALEPGITLLDYAAACHDSEELGLQKKGKRKQDKAPSKKSAALPPMPTSPTLNRKAASTKLSKPSRASPIPTARNTPPPLPPGPMPSTPPRNHRISPVHTPLSHKGLHMSPSASLAHYKSNLDPPPAVTFALEGGVNEDGGETEDLDPMRTPSRKRTVASGIFPPVTPKKLVFPSSNSFADSPFRTPSGGLGASPFRTPGSRGIFDPHDPGALLDEELSRMGAAGLGDSPAGLFGRGQGTLLYESPNPLEGSPGRFARWW